MANVLIAKDCWDAYFKSLKMLIDNKYDLRNVFVEIENTDENYVTFMPHSTDPLYWYLRVNSDVVEGELGIGCGLDVRYDQRRMSRVKGHGSTDWDYRLETGRPEDDPTALNVILPRDEIFPNTSYQNMQRVGGRGQLHAVKDLLLLDKGSDKGIVTFWHYERDLLEYTRRRHIQKNIMGMKRWTDSQHQRIPCPITWHFSYSPNGINNSVYSRSLVWDGHIYDDLFRFVEPAKWIGGHMKKKSGKLTMLIYRLWQTNFKREKERWEATYNYWLDRDWIRSYYDPIIFPEFKSKEEFEREWLLKELAEQDYRMGAFQEGDEKLEALQSEYYKEWVRAMKVADMTIAHRILGSMLQKGIVSRPTKRALDYVESYGLKQAILDLKGIFRVQSVQWVVNYILRSGTTDMDYREFLEILPDELQQLVLAGSLNKVKKDVREDIIRSLDKEVVLISEYNDMILPPKTVAVKGLKESKEASKKDDVKKTGETEKRPENVKNITTITTSPSQGVNNVREPIVTDNEPKVLVVAPYGGKRLSRKYPDLIERSAENIDYCYFPIEPFHYREKRYNETQRCFETCLIHRIPMSIETRKEVPEWAVEALTADKSNELKIQINTLDPKKWKLQYPGRKADDPEKLVNSFVNSFTRGIYTVLKIAPIIPGLITLDDVFSVVNRLQNWTPEIEICFAYFKDEDFQQVNKNIVSQVREFFYEKDGIWKVNDDYRLSFLERLHKYADGQKLKLNILNEPIESGEDVEVINFGKEK